MKFDRKIKIELGASTDETRPVLTYIYLDAEAGELQATDSYKLVRLPVELNEDGKDVTGFIPADVFKEFRKPKHGQYSELIAGKDTIEIVHGDKTLMSWPRPQDVGQFPDAKKLWPDDNTTTFRIGVNAKNLYEAAQAMGATDKAIELSCISPLRPITLGGSADGKALVMPIRIPGSDLPDIPALPEPGAEGYECIVVIKNGTVSGLYCDGVRAFKVVDTDIDDEVTEHVAAMVTEAARSWAVKA